jgi:hypothetical protein
MKVFSDKTITWDKYGECELDEDHKKDIAILHQKTIRSNHPLLSSAPCSGSTQQMRMCQRSANVITELDGVISVENSIHKGKQVGSVQPSKNVKKIKCVMPQEPEKEKNCFAIYFFIVLIIMAFSGCGAIIFGEEKESCDGGSEYITYTNSGDLL